MFMHGYAGKLLFVDLTFRIMPVAAAG